MEPGSPPVDRVPVAADSRRSSLVEVLRNLDLLALLVALPVFVLADAPIEGYLAAGGAWLIGRAAIELAARRRAAALAAGDRRSAISVTAFATMGRVWLIAGAILLVGLIGEREAGLAAALLALALVTVSLVASFATHALHPDADPTLR